MHIESTLVKKTITWGSMVLLGAVLGVSLQYASAGWTPAPAGVPPTGNVNGPITTGGNQTKAGKLETAGTVVGDSASTVVTKGYLEANYVNAAGPGQPVRGGHYGGCTQWKNENFIVDVGLFVAWPVTRCPSTGAANDASSWPTCANGYTPIILSQSQANAGAYGVTRASEGMGGFPRGVSKYDDRLDIYYLSWACAKN